MVATESTMVPLGFKAQNFCLPNYSAQGGSLTKLHDFKHQSLCVMFICNHCPYVIYIMPELVRVARLAQSLGFGVVAINANDAIAYPKDSPVEMRKFAEEHQLSFSYCYDETQAVAKAYQAVCTPDFFVYDEIHALRYRGQFDGSRPSNTIAITGQDLRIALMAVAQNTEVPTSQIPSIGCNIKWKTN